MSPRAHDDGKLPAPTGAGSASSSAPDVAPAPANPAAGMGKLNISIESDDGRSITTTCRLVSSATGKLLSTVSWHAPHGHASQAVAALWEALKPQMDQKLYELDERLDKAPVGLVAADVVEHSLADVAAPSEEQVSIGGDTSALAALPGEPDPAERRIAAVPQPKRQQPLTEVKGLRFKRLTTAKQPRASTRRPKRLVIGSGARRDPDKPPRRRGKGRRPTRKPPTRS